MSAKVVIIRALEACNAGCFMCSYAFSKDEYRLSREALAQILVSLRGSDAKLLRFTGGEPLLLSDIPAMLADIRAEGLQSSIISNGWFLEDRADALAEAGLGQIIVSLDAPFSREHDRFRRLEGLFDRLIRGIRKIRAHPATPLVRVNTVVGAHNIHMLKEMWTLLCDVGAQQWSLIPLKRAAGAWGNLKLKEIENHMEAFQEHVASGQERTDTLRVLGYGLNLFGRSSQAREEIWQARRTITPRSQCELVDQIKYYAPKDEQLFPCNCVPHRSGARVLYEDCPPSRVGGSALREARIWLREFGPRSCTGCEPINAALGDSEIDLDQDVFGF